MIYIIYTYQRLAGRDGVTSNITARRLPLLQVIYHIYIYIYVCMYICNIYIYISVYIIYTYQRLAGRDGVTSNITARRFPLFHIRCAQILVHICLYICMCTFHAYTRIYVYTHICNIYIFMYTYISGSLAGMMSAVVSQPGNHLFSKSIYIYIYIYVLYTNIYIYYIHISAARSQGWCQQ